MLFKFKPDWYIYEFVFWSYIKLLLALSSSGTCMEATWKLFRLTCFLISGTYVICKWIRLLFPIIHVFVRLIILWSLHWSVIFWLYFGRLHTEWLSVWLYFGWVQKDSTCVLGPFFWLSFFSDWPSVCFFWTFGLAVFVSVYLTVVQCLFDCLCAWSSNIIKKKLFSCQVPGIKPHRNNARRLVFQAKRFVAIVSWIMRYC